MDRSDCGGWTSVEGGVKFEKLGFDGSTRCGGILEVPGLGVSCFCESIDSRDDFVDPAAPQVEPALRGLVGVDVLGSGGTA